MASGTSPTFCTFTSVLLSPVSKMQEERVVSCRKATFHYCNEPSLGGGVKRGGVPLLKQSLVFSGPNPGFLPSGIELACGLGLEIGKVYRLQI